MRGKGIDTPAEPTLGKRFSSGITRQQELAGANRKGPAPKTSRDIGNRLKTGTRRAPGQIAPAH